MATSTKSPTRFTSDSSVGVVAWSNPSNASSSNDSRATVTLNNQQSQYLKATACQFSIPTNATIDGVEVLIEKSRTAGTGTLDDTSIFLIRKGTILSSGQNRQSQGSAWTGSDATSTYGGTDDLWAVPWTADDINDPQFGVVFSVSETAGSSATAGIDHIQIRVTYTSGYLASPQVQRPGEVVLFGKRYNLKSEADAAGLMGPGKVRVGLASVQPQKIVTNRDYDRSSSLVHSSFSVDDLRGGMGHPKYLFDDEGNIVNKTCFYVGKNICTLDPREITLGPLVTDTGFSTAQGGTNDGEVNITSRGGVLIGTYEVLAGAASVFRHNGTAWVTPAVDALPGRIQSEPVHFNGRVFYAQGSNGYSYQAAANSAATDVAAPLATSFTVWDDKLYAVDTSNQLWASTTGDAGSWGTGLATLPNKGEDGIAPVRLLTYDDASNELAVWALTNVGPFVYDAEANRWRQQRFQYFAGYLLTRNPATVFRDSLYVETFERPARIHQLTMRGGLLVRDVTPGIAFTPINTLDNVSNLTIGNLAATSDFLVMLMYTHLSISGWVVGIFLGVQQENGSIAWHPVVVQDPASVATLFTGLYVGKIATSPSATHSVYWHGADASGDEIYVFDLQALMDPPSQSTTRAYAASGYVELPRYDANMPEELKTADDCRIKLRGASANETVQIAYRINGSTGSYTNLGSAVTVNDEITIPFGTNGEGLDFKDIQFKLTFARGSTTTNSPKLEYFVLDFTRTREVLRGYTITLDLDNLSPDGRTQQQQIDHLYSHLKSGLYGTFAWRDDAGNTRSSLVKVMNQDGMESTGFNFASTYTLQLVEMGWN